MIIHRLFENGLAAESRNGDSPAEKRNQEFRQDLELSGLDAQTKLNILIEDTSSLLYSFIKIE